MLTALATAPRLRVCGCCSITSCLTWPHSTKREMLIGDAWGLKNVGPDMTSEQDLDFLDKVASALQSPDDWDALTKLYQDGRLNIPAVIDHYPLHDPWQAEKVHLTFVD